MAARYPILASSDYNLRAQISAALGDLSDRIDLIINFLMLPPNSASFRLGADPTWLISAGAIPIIPISSAGNNPPTISGNVITIDSPGLYEVRSYVGVDIDRSGNSVIADVLLNGTAVGISAGVEFSGGQSAPVTQPGNGFAAWLLSGDTISFDITPSGTGSKYIYWILSGGYVHQLKYDFSQYMP